MRPDLKDKKKEGKEGRGGEGKKEICKKEMHEDKAENPCLNPRSHGIHGSNVRLAMYVPGLSALLY